MLTPLVPIPRRRGILFCLLLALFEFLTYIGMDAIMPGMLEVIRDMKAASVYVPWSLNIYLLGSVAYLWLIGPLSDRYGRRPTLLSGSALFTFSTFFLAVVKNINLFILIRFLQGTGLGFVVAVSYPCLQELYEEADALRLIALTANIALLSPMLGPMFGSSLLACCSWRGIFVSIGAASLICWLGLFKIMPETIDKPLRSGGINAAVAINFKNLFSDYASLLKNRHFLGGAISMGLLALPIMSWISASPLILMSHWHMSYAEYSLSQIPIFAFVMGGNVILNQIAGKCSIETIIIISAIPIACGVLSTLILALTFNNPYVLIATLCVYAFGFGIGNATLYRKTLLSSSQGLGTSSALIGMISVGVIDLGGMLISAFKATQYIQGFAVAASIPAVLSLLLIACLMRQFPLCNP